MSRRRAPGSRVAAIDGGETTISERHRHRHRYEVNIRYKARLEDGRFGLGVLILSGDPKGRSRRMPKIARDLGPSVVRRRASVAELKSKPFDPHPLFTSFIKPAVEQSRLV